MAERHEKIYSFEGTGSQIGSPPMNEVNSQFTFEHGAKQIDHENHSLIRWLTDVAQPPTTGLLDPIQRFPPEISTSIIQYALLPEYPHFQRGYSSGLLNLTAVSLVWFNFLISTPVLWSKIYLDDRQQDFLATVAIFVHFSSEACLRVAIYDRPMNDWAGLSSILTPVHQRITSLTLLEPNWASGDYTSAISNFFNHVGPLPQLRELAFGDNGKPTISVFDSIDLPSTVRVSGTLTLPIQPSAQSSATPSRFFDIDKYNSFGPTPLVAPLFRSCTLSLGYFYNVYKATVEMREEVLAHLRQSCRYINGHVCRSAATNSPKSNSDPSSVQN